MQTPFQTARGLTGLLPVVPSWWPSRSVRRAVKQGRESRLSADWKAFLALNPNLRRTIITAI